MYSNFRKNELGSVLIAVIGILGVLSIMAISFSIEMQAVVSAANEAPKKLDVKNVARSGRNYVIAKLLESSSNYKNLDKGHDQLLIEQETELVDNTDPNKRVLGDGVPSIILDYNSLRFYDGGFNNDDLNSYVPLAYNLNNASLRFLVEDLSAKLPIGRVQEYFQRNLLTHILYNYLTGKSLSDTQNGGKTVKSEMFMSSDLLAKNDLDENEQYIRSLTPAGRLSNGLTPSRYQGIPFFDGLIHAEELASTQTSYTLSAIKSSAADDKLRPKNKTRALKDALTPYSRFIRDPNHEIAYASINPLIMSAQNPLLFDALFNFVSDDSILKLQHSVGFDPVGGAAVDNTVSTTTDFVLAQEDFFSTHTSGKYIFMSMPGTPAANDEVSFAYNARNSAGDNLNTVNYNGTNVKFPSERFWSNPIINFDPISKSADDVYYTTMKNVVGSLKKQFNYLNRINRELVPVVTREALEYVIIKAVFGDALVLIEGNFDVGADRKYTQVDLAKIYFALEEGKIDLSKVIFVSNILEDATSTSKVKNTTDANQCFVPDWEHVYDGRANPGNEIIGYSSASIKRPALGYLGGIINYLPHPETNQKGLANFYPTIDAFYSKLNDAAALGIGGGKIDDDKRLFDLYSSSGTVLGISQPIHYNGSKKVYFNLDTRVVELEAGQTDYAICYKEEDFTPVENQRHLMPADFSPFETKIRMAVLVNLLNSIIPPKLAETKNSSINGNTLFSTVVASPGNNNNLKNFILFDEDTREYVINQVGNPRPYMNGWKAGNKTPGMALWKFGQHSTTFKVTVDAAKESESVRLSEVITFDFNTTNKDYNELIDGIDLSVPAKKDLFSDPALLNAVSYIHLTPNNRMGDAEKYVIGTGKYRTPTPDINGWRIISTLWSDINLMDTTGVEGNRWVPFICIPSQVANLGTMGEADHTKKGFWYFVNHPSEVEPFTQFCVKGDARTTPVLGPSGSYSDKDITLGTGKIRKFACGTGSWLMWKRVNNKEMAANELRLELSCNRPSKSDADVQISLVAGDRDSPAFFTKTFFLNKWNGYYSATIDKVVPKGSIYIFIKYLDDKDNYTTIYQLRVIKP